MVWCCKSEALSWKSPKEISGRYREHEMNIKFGHHFCKSKSSFWRFACGLILSSKTTNNSLFEKHIFSKTSILIWYLPPGNWQVGWYQGLQNRYIIFHNQNALFLSLWPLRRRRWQAGEWKNSRILVVFGPAHKKFSPSISSDTITY